MITLIEKLKLYKFDSNNIEWFTSYLSERYQQTVVSNVASDPGPVVSGVPQGSVLGPILFLIYINDLPNDIENTTVDIFADDTTLFTSGNNVSSITSSLESDLQNVQAWCKNNCMALNAAKTKVMYIAPKSKSSSASDTLPHLQLDSEILQVSSCEKLLGINIDNSLSWHTHVSNTLKRCNSYLYLLSRIKHFLSIETRKLFYNAYIMPHLDYCCVVWGNCNQSLLDKVVRFQKQAARVILHVTDFNTPSEEMFSTLNWMTFPERIKYQKSILMYKIIHKRAPQYLLEDLTFTSSVHNRNMRSSSTYKTYIPKPKTEFFRKTLLYSGSVLWNELPTHIQNAKSVPTFKHLYLKWKKQSL